MGEKLKVAASAPAQGLPRVKHPKEPFPKFHLPVCLPATETAFYTGKPSLLTQPVSVDTEKPWKKTSRNDKSSTQKSTLHELTLKRSPDFSLFKTSLLSAMSAHTYNMFANKFIPI